MFLMLFKLECRAKTKDNYTATCLYLYLNSKLQKTTKGKDVGLVMGSTDCTSCQDHSASTAHLPRNGAVCPSCEAQWMAVAWMYGFGDGLQLWYGNDATPTAGRRTTSGRRSSCAIGAPLCAFWLLVLLFTSLIDRALGNCGEAKVR